MKYNRGQGDARGQYITKQGNQNLPDWLPYGFIHCPFACGCPLRPSGQTQDKLGLQEESHAANSQKTTSGTVIFGTDLGPDEDEWCEACSAGLTLPHRSSGLED